MCLSNSNTKSLKQLVWIHHGEVSLKFATLLPFGAKGSEGQPKTHSFENSQAEVEMCAKPLRRKEEKGKIESGIERKEKQRTGRMKDVKGRVCRMKERMSKCRIYTEEGKKGINGRINGRGSNA